MKTKNVVSVPNGCRQSLKQTRSSTKKDTKTRITGNNDHCTKDSSTTGHDAPHVVNRQTDEPVKGCQAATDASLVAPPQSMCSVNPAKTKKRPRRKTSSPTTDVQPLTAKFRLRELRYKNNRMLYIPLQIKQCEISAPLDTGAIQSALSETELRRIVTAYSSALLDELPTPDYRIQISNSNTVPVHQQVLLRFFLAGRIFKEKFMILPTMGNILIGMPFFKKQSVTLDF